jgi:hypothetical protein
VVLLHENFNTKFGTHRMFYQVGEALAVLATDGTYRKNIGRLVKG